ncbi:MAG: MFS transporter [Jiangellaceae bacterium]
MRVCVEGKRAADAYAGALIVSPISSYRRLLALTGPAYVVVAFLGRLPLAMSQLGTLLLVSTVTGSYGLGGLAAGALAVANAVGAPLAGGIADRHGQRPVVLVQAVSAGIVLSALVVAAETGARASTLVVLAAVTGFLMPQVGPFARARWRPITRGAGQAQPRLVDAAFSSEGAADEASFVLGPGLVGVFAVAVSPGGALLIAAALLVVFGCWFALDQTARLAHAEQPARLGAPVRLVTVAFVVLFVAQLFIGVVFGATQTGTTVLATAVGEPGLAGLVHALLGVGSVIAGLAVVWLPRRFGYELRMIVAAAGLFVLALPLLVVDSLGGLVIVVLALGIAVAPYMISVFALAEKIVPPTRVGAAMTLLAGATGIGYALGSGIAGQLADLGGHTPAFAVTVAAGLFALVLTTTFRSRLAAQQRRVEDIHPDDLPAVGAGSRSIRH